MKMIALTKGFYALVDDEDLEALSKFTWHAASKMIRTGPIWYAARRQLSMESESGAHPIVYMHRMLLGADASCCVDHKNGNSLDNQKVNLRLCTKRQNVLNQNPIKPWRKSPFKGVRETKFKRFESRIRVNDKVLWLGTFSTAIEAATAYDEAAVKHFGEFARLNNERV